MRGRPIWAASVWGGFICVLFALSSTMHGSLGAGAVLAAGALLFFGWALWLGSHHH